MTFLAPAKTGDVRIPAFLFGRRPRTARLRPRIADEDGARRALGGDGHLPLTSPSGTSIEHLARVALG